MKIFGALSLTIAALCSSSALAGPVKLDDAQLAGIVAGADFQVIGKIADQSGVAPVTDPDLVNPWGLSSAPGGPLWVANNGTGTSTIYDNTTFAKLPLTVDIPAPGGGGAGAPTGTVFTSLSGNDFMIHEGAASGHSLFLFATEDGTIVGWSPAVSTTQGVIAVDQSGAGAVFKGLTLWSTPGLDRLYAADFINGRVDVFDGGFHQVGSFTDSSLPAGYAPFNVQVLNHQIYVTFALQGEGHDEAHGAGLGYVDVFNVEGHLVHRLVSNGPLNAPWGLTIAPPSFGKFAGALLVGNFGDGAINAFDPHTGAFLGQLKGPSGPISIDGLWALRNGPDGAVIFSSGPNDENNGLVGVIRPTWAAASWAFRAHVTH